MSSFYDEGDYQMREQQDQTNRFTFNFEYSRTDRAIDEPVKRSWTSKIIKKKED